MASAAVSRLEQMQARFQQKQLAEREQKMVALLEERQARALGRVRASPTQAHTQGKVRQMFEERRQQQHGASVASVGGTRAGVGGTRAGVDRGHPLRPIRHENRNTEYDSYTKTQDVNHNSVHHQHNIIIQRFENINLKDTDDMDNLINIEDETFPESLCASPAIRPAPPVLAPIHDSPKRPSRSKPVPPARKSRASPPKATRKAPAQTISNGNKSSDDDVTLPRHQTHTRVRNEEVRYKKQIAELNKDQSHARGKAELSDDEMRDKEQDDLIRNRCREQEEQLHERHDRNSKEFDIKEELPLQTLNHSQNGHNDKQSSSDRVCKTEEVTSRAARSHAPRASPSRTSGSPDKVAPSTRSRTQPTAARASPPKSLGKYAMSTPRQTNKSAASPTAAGGAGAKGVACKVCARTFAPDRVERHQKICQKTSTKKRKPYDILKHRVAGTEAEPFLRQLRKQQTPPKASSAGRGGRGGGPAASSSNTSNKPLNSCWRQKHEDFIRSIRAAKKVQAHIKAGGNVRDLPPPPPSENPDYVQCPHCQRRFNKAAADRHIPKCQDYQYNKPKPQARNVPVKKPGPPARPPRR